MTTKQQREAEARALTTLARSLQFAASPDAMQATEEASRILSAAAKVKFEDELTTDQVIERIHRKRSEAAMHALIFAGHRYVTTDADRLALLRALNHEGRDHNQVAQALVNGFCHDYACQREVSLEHHVQAYAQPINPLWFPDGRMYLHYHAINPEKYTLKDAERRRDVFSQVTTFEPAIIAAADKALTMGPVDIPACCTDYAAPGLVNHWQTRLPTPDDGRNWLWTRAEKWTGYTVTVA